VSIGSGLPAIARTAAEARAKLGQLEGKRDLIAAIRQRKAAELEAVRNFLDIADAVETALDKLSEQLFGQVVRILEEQLTKALQEVLDQALKLKVSRDNKRGVATIGFYIERDEKPEDIMKGQRGSVVNVLSVGLRMFALKTLSSDVHRRFLVLDEQDCWLQAALVPKLVKIVHDAGRLLGFKVLMISHHDVSAFERYAEKIYEFIPTAEGVLVKERVSMPTVPDEEA
jgi:hypothetical protein